MLEIRNIAVIAHVDHGKTTLIDNMLKQSGMFRNNEEVLTKIMDCNDIERERGITIFAKCTSLHYENIKYNIIDTPGHADFGGEVERVLSMVDGVILLIDASEGPMSQTKFVLSKALSIGLKPIVIINKVDRADSRINEVLNEVFDLFCSLGANEEQLDFPVLYAVGRDGWASEKNIVGQDLKPLFNMISSYVPAPKVKHLLPFSMLASMLTIDSYLGKVLIGKVYSGSVKIGDNLKSMNLKGKFIENIKLTNIFHFKGIKRIPVKHAEAGDIIGITGAEQTSISDTICCSSINNPIQSYVIDPPTMAITISVNSSPLSGIDGSKVTSRMILERLKKEVESNITITLRILDNMEAFEISGRGELQLGVLIENMRRDGFEFSISRPRVLFQNTPSGKKLEPIEEVTIDVDETYSNIVIKKLLLRKADLITIKPFTGDKTRLLFYIPSRGLIGYLTEFRNDTRGTGILNRVFSSYQEYKGSIDSRKNGVLISNVNGEATSYALCSLLSRGKLFIPPRTKVYQGMIIGQHNRVNDLEVNPVKGKKLSNMRASGTDSAIKLTPHTVFKLEEVISYIKDDELIEVTPKNIRLRKSTLCPIKRKKISIK